MAQTSRFGGRLIQALIVGLVILSGVAVYWFKTPDSRSSSLSRPNIILIVVDDLGYEALTCYGGQSYQTPNIDQLAAGGTRFTQCYGQSICTPTRAQIVTGLYPCSTGTSRLLRDLPDGTIAVDPKLHPQIGSILKSAGYATLVVGKWALADLEAFPSHVNDCGFDEYNLWVRKPRVQNRVARYWDPNILRNGDLVDTSMGDYGPDMSTDYLIDFIRRHPDNPFFAYYPMTLVHGPYLPTPVDQQGNPAKGKRQENIKKNFGDMVYYMDGLVGRIVEELDGLGIRENTLIIITADNGSPASVTSIMNGKEVVGGKRTLTDRGIRLPFIANQPGTVPAGRVYDQLVDFSDLLPTLAELAKADLPTDKTPIDGHSFAEQLHGKPGPTRQWIFSQLHDDMCLRTLQWKLFNNGSLYDMLADPDEQSPIDTNSGNLTEEATAVVAQLAPVMQTFESASENNHP